jgi:hypothetical protein
MRTFAALVAGGVLSLAMGTLPGSTASTSPGKNSAFESASLTNLSTAPAPLLTATIAKGKKKRVLAIEASLTTDSGAAGVLEIRPFVNGFATEGQAAQVTCAPSLLHCTVSGTWWLDIDAAEVASPGLYVKQPLVVVLQGGVLPGGDSDISATATLSVRVESK